MSRFPLTPHFRMAISACLGSATQHMHFANAMNSFFLPRKVALQRSNTRFDMIPRPYVAGSYVPRFGVSAVVSNVFFVGGSVRFVSCKAFLVCRVLCAVYVRDGTVDDKCFFLSHIHMRKRSHTWVRQRMPKKKKNGSHTQRDSQHIEKKKQSLTVTSARCPIACQLKLPTPRAVTTLRLGTLHKLTHAALSLFRSLLHKDSHSLCVCVTYLWESRGEILERHFVFFVTSPLKKTILFLKSVTQSGWETLETKMCPSESVMCLGRR